MDLRVGRCLIPDLATKAGKNQSIVAKEVGISDSYMSMIVSKKRKADLLLLKKIATSCNCKIDDLFEWIGEGGSN